jgi:hypothetical protein
MAVFSDWDKLKKLGGFYSTCLSITNTIEDGILFTNCIRKEKTA